MVVHYWEIDGWISPFGYVNTEGNNVILFIRKAEHALFQWKKGKGLKEKELTAQKFPAISKYDKERLMSEYF